MNYFIYRFYEAAANHSAELIRMRESLRKKIAAKQLPPEAAQGQFKTLQLMFDFYRTSYYAVASVAPTHVKKHVFRPLKRISIKDRLKELSQ